MVKGKLFVICFCATFLYSLAMAVPLATDPAAMPAFRGSQNFSTSSGSLSLQGRVEYAVYAPGAYSGSLVIPTGQYAYAYQVFSNAASNVNTDIFLVGLQPAASVVYTASDIAHGVTGGIKPGADFILSQSVMYLFNTIAVTPNTHSQVMIFTSPQSPIMGFAAVVAGYMAATVPSVPTPNPIPEPATMAVLGIGSGILIALRKQKK